MPRIWIDKWYKKIFGHICIAKDLLELIKKKKKKRFARRARERSQQWISINVKTVDTVQTAVIQYVFLITLPTPPPPPPPRSLYLLLKVKGEKNKIKSLYGIFYPCSKFSEVWIKFTRCQVDVLKLSLHQLQSIVFSFSL